MWPKIPLYRLLTLKPLLLLVLGLPVPSHASLATASAHDCMACHAVDRTFNAPSFRQIGARYKGDKAAEDRLVLKVRNGSVGAWGRNSMPPQAITEADARKVVRWVLTHK